MPASAAGEKKEPIGLIFFVEDYGGSKKPPMMGLREDIVEFGLRQSGKKPGAKIRRKCQNPTARYIAAAVHHSLVPASVGAGSDLCTDSDRRFFELAAPTMKVVEVWLWGGECLVRSYRVAVAANFFTMASSSLRSLSFRLVE